MNHKDFQSWLYSLFLILFIILIIIMIADEIF
jgi:hypothetical protein